MNRNQMVATVTGFLAALAAVVIPIGIVTTNSTARFQACVENGGSYVHVANTTAMECQK